MSTRVGKLLVVAIHVLVSSGNGQAVQYRPTDDTTRFLSQNSYFMYFLSGADTLGEPVVTVTAESHVARQTENGLELWVQMADSAGREVYTQNVYGVSPAGRVKSEDGFPLGARPAQRVDLLPRLLPQGALTVGTEWSDTVSVASGAAYGDTWYEAERRYRVVSMADSLGTTVAVLAAEGAVNLRKGGWQDSVQGMVWWQEVGGMVRDTAWIDAVGGQLIGSVTTIDLQGTGGAGPKGSSGGIPSGLRSTVRRVRRSSC